MQEMSAVGIPPSSLQGCIYSVFRNKRLILKAFYVELTLFKARQQVQSRDDVTVVSTPKRGDKAGQMGKLF